MLYQIIILLVLFVVYFNGVQNVLMEQCAWLVVYQKTMVVWSSATGECGVQCVMILGTTMMQPWCADSWAIVQSVSFMLRKNEVCVFEP